MKKIYIIRHCEAEGQDHQAQLTDIGCKQALEISEFISDLKVDRIISSPYKRAVQSIQPLAKRLNIDIEFDSRLTERVLSTNNLSDWIEKLKTSFEDIEVKFEGGESSQEAMKRIVNVVEEVFNSKYEHTILVSHGNLISLLLKYYNRHFGFDEWRSLSNPDIFLLENVNNQVSYARLWRERPK